MGTALLLKSLPIWTVWIAILILLPNILTTDAQKKTAPPGLKREVFFLNLEDGYFGCQVNESVDVLQLFELSKLCDGSPQCFMGSDEDHKELKCTDNCAEATGKKCQNGACLESQCHCNDGYGGKGCEMPDENECKFRPCDVFSHCTNTMGSFFCTCFPGYAGDGFKCKDIDECENPALRARCVKNAECCNLPAHFLCKCLPGFEGDGEVSCVDIDECKNKDACGESAICENVPGNYTCSCPKGFSGNPYDQCIDINECELRNSCGPGARCTNTRGGHTCECPLGFQGNPNSPEGCVDIDECSQPNTCGSNSICTNTPGSFTCNCPRGFQGDPTKECTDINECTAAANETTASLCGVDADCINEPGSFRCECSPGFTGEDPYVQGCVDINECGRATACGINAKCFNVPGSFKCLCPRGFIANPDPYVFCENVNECKKEPCKEKNAECVDTMGSYTCKCKDGFKMDAEKCVDIDECAQNTGICGQHAICQNESPGYNCICPQGFAAKPDAKIACEQVDVTTLCSTAFDCVNNAECVDGQCFCRDGFVANRSTCFDVDECLKNPCGPNSICQNSLGGFGCVCQDGFIGAPPTKPCKAPCEGVKCGNHAFCKADGAEAYCVCDDGWSFDPKNISAGCMDMNECDRIHGPSGLCGEKAICQNREGSFSCSCPAGFSGNPNIACHDIDECKKIGTCGVGAVCINLVGGFECSCPDGTVPDPDPKTKCQEVIKCKGDKDCPGNAFCDSLDGQCLCPEPNVGNNCRHPCEELTCGPNTECMLINSEAKCLCRAGYSGSATATSGCADIDECANNPCGPNSVCKNLPGKFVCECPSGFESASPSGPLKAGCKSIAPSGCSALKPCPSGEQCVQAEGQNQNVCVCLLGFARDEESGRCRDVDECFENRDKPPCGLNSICKNLPGSYECKCPQGYSGNPFSLCEECNSVECKCQPPYKVVNGTCVFGNCSPQSPCPKGAECISVTGGLSYCACPSGFTIAKDGSCEDVDECQGNRRPCGIGAECKNLQGSYECFCPPGYNGDPYNGACSAALVRCTKDNECSANEKCVQPGECICSPPYFTDTQDGNKCKSPCDRFPCGVNSQCSPSDPPQCMCEPGYQFDGFACVDTNECTSNPCGPGATCLNTKGGFKCVCLKGAKGDPYVGGCKADATQVECAVNSDCPNPLTCESGRCTNPCESLPCGAHAVCEPEDHAAWCRCLPGFVKGPNEECVSVCEGMLCGDNAQCVPAVQPICKCLEGFAGNPFPGGQCVPDVCSVSNPCQEPQVCVGGRCKERCEDVVCGVGASCDKNTNQCQCLPFHTGNPNLKCAPPTAPPACSPGCGQNAHCEYQGGSNVCICNPGTTGNPYEVCGAQERTCTATQCGQNAECREGGGKIECVCESGYTGNPYIKCEDVNECIGGNACGQNAVCINQLGKFDCRCREGFVGNPYEQCHTPPPSNLVDCNKVDCKCGGPGSNSNTCPVGFSCSSGVCRDLCKDVSCGRNAVCSQGKCLCPPSFNGNPLRECKSESCENDLNCKSSEICFAVSLGQRKCVDGCTRIQCGPNSICVTEQHRSYCICNDGYKGNPTDLRVGCQLGSNTVHECDSNTGCSKGHVCQPDINGIRKCVDPCVNFVCNDPNEVCTAIKGRPSCQCLDSFVRNPETSQCEQPVFPDCQKDGDCALSEACRPDGLGVLRCTSVCAPVNCPSCNTISCAPNTQCIAVQHQPTCACLPGFTGSPIDRNGCQPVTRDQCQSDAQCDENEACVQKGSSLQCAPVCENVQCGPGAVPVSNNHQCQCQCPPGKFKGDPNDLKQGCVSVPCVYNDDCPAHQLCNRLENRCYDVCDEGSCGQDAVCIVEKRTAVCSCPVGSKPDPHPDIKCSTVNSCENNPCHSTAVCESGVDGFKCKCPVDSVGDPYSLGCRAKGSCVSDENCPPGSACQNGGCINPCEGLCGSNAQCTVTANRKGECSCISGFEGAPTPDKACVRVSKSCRNDLDCPGSLCIGEQCKIICRSTDDCAGGERCVSSMCMLPCIGHLQCPHGQACAGGFCVAGCRSNSECQREESCINHQCLNPCEAEGACGPNSLCRPISHSAQCYCPDGFSGNPTPIEGCSRKPLYCTSSGDCSSGSICVGGLCVVSCDDNAQCAKGERCQNNMCRKVCYQDSNCQTGEVCVEGACHPGCRSDGDCGAVEVCISNKCRCGPGFDSGPTGCRDINECDTNPCHPSALCSNTPGSFKCTCPEGMFGDAFTQGCSPPHLCDSNSNCPETLSCLRGPDGVRKCVDPCPEIQSQCAPRSKCIVSEHKAQCVCPEDHLGDPYKKDIGCYPVECLNSEDCSQDKKCDLSINKCVNPCDSSNCGKGICKVENHEGVCTCNNGYELKNGKCQDINECLLNVCHSTALCRNTAGGFKCYCGEGLVGEALREQSGCRRAEECFADLDCPETANCKNGKCKDACENTCAKNAECRYASNHQVTCSCPINTIGDPLKECKKLECTDANDCSATQNCFNNKCIDPCQLSNVCGQNTNCTTVAHQAVCQCNSGFFGDPLYGCFTVLQCSESTLCPASSKCTNGICTPICSSNRDCLNNQICLEGACQGTCKQDLDCTSFQSCQNGICQAVAQCKADTDCKIDEVCRENRYGQPECQHVCNNLVLCGRNAQCTAANHSPICTCREGYFGNPQDDKLGCQPIECLGNNDCSADKVCQDYKCHVACRVKNPCTENAICISENHDQKCQCSPGYTGNPSQGCTPIDFCKEKPCGPGSVCDNTRGSFKCLCPLGTVGDPYSRESGCLPIPECQKDDDCPEAAVCLRDSGNSKCKSVCDNIQCGPNSLCTFRQHQGFCQCQEGYEGNPKDLIQGCTPKPVPCKSNADCKQNTFCDGNLCKPPCQGDGECGPLEVCVRNQCTNPCDAPSSCGLNSVCKMAFHQKTCSCPVGFTGNADVECVRISIPCQNSQECGAGYSCTEGLCLLGCTEDSNCAMNERCLQGKCLLTCRVDNDCFLSHICLNNMCVIGCRTNDDCSGGESCIGQRCTNPCLSQSCGPNALCQTVNHQAQCSCPVGMLANPTPFVGCVREPKLCTGNRDCGDRLLCDAGTCRPICSSSENCISNEICDKGLCKPICRKDGDCRSGEICEGLTCLAGCRADTECLTNQACVNSKCIDPCSSPIACGTNSECSVTKNQVICKCKAGLIGDARVACKAPQLPCSPTQACSAGLTCIESTCRATCKSDGNCLSDERCIGGVCKPLCNTDENCERGYICQGRICLAGCRSDSHCPAELSCVNRQCKDPCKSSIACGACATCEVKNHSPICSCPASSFGNPLVQCSTPPQRCINGNGCTGGSKCEGGYCIGSCQGDADCACGQSCQRGQCRSQCSADDSCPQGQVCKSGLCAIGCRANSDCDSETACINGQCMDPCKQAPSPCGINAVCRVSQSRPVCLCPNGFQGEPSKECKQIECNRDNDCANSQMCLDGNCRNPCLMAGACGKNFQCRVINRKAQCTCPPGHRPSGTGANLECVIDENECLSNPCGENSKCTDTAVGYRCSCNSGCSGDPTKGCVCKSQDACASVRCGINAECRVDIQTGQGLCICPRNFPSGDPFRECQPERSDDCRAVGCGSGAQCVSQGNLFVCQCLPGTTGNPEVECVQGGCRSNSECPSKLACINGLCGDPCRVSNPCTKDQECVVEGHTLTCVSSPKRNCNCPPNTQCNALTGECTPDTKKDTGCTADSDCGDKFSCRNKQCVNPCTLLNPCAQNAECEVIRHVPQCRCPDSLLGDPYRSCYPAVPRPGRNCLADLDCNNINACLDSQCQNPCFVANPCPKTAVCKPFEHRPYCMCEGGTVPKDGWNPAMGCIAAEKPECTVDQDCPSNKACVSQVCRDPCALSNPCGQSAICRTRLHRPLCVCPENWAGNPQVRCYQPECTSDNECPSDRQCISEKCVDPCVYGTNVCAPTARCRAVAHRSQCYCPQGTQGNPSISCVSVGCLSDNDCAGDESCDPINRVCRSVCRPTTCAQRASCRGQDHVPICTCPIGTTGDPYIRCQEEVRTPPPPPTRECESDSQCASLLACVNNRCVDPCSIGSPCSPSQECRVMNSVPYRSIVCQCPSDTVQNNAGLCTKIAVVTETGCKSDSECALTEKCIRTQCIDACLVESCGLNAVCKSANNQGICMCLSGYEGNPRVECRLPQTPIAQAPECEANSDCPFDKSCVNRVCVNPCTTFEPCARTAVCHVSNHAPVCRCPTGTDVRNSDPYVECRYPSPVIAVECTSNSDCPSDKSCVNTRCVNPCNCGPNANCRIINHYAICECQNGYSGNPNSGCFQLGCSSDSECADDQQCHNRQCINACAYNNPCAINARCISRLHRANCECPAGYEGDAFVRCEPIGCRSNSDCPSNRACIDRNCVNPCIYTTAISTLNNRYSSVCAPDAVCIPLNHAASCRCQSGYIGNPSSFCERIDVVTPAPECTVDSECGNGLACIGERCLDPCREIGPCDSSAICKTINSVPVRTMMCVCPENWAPNENGQCKPVIPALPQPGCQSDSECPSTEACINRQCRDPCDCGRNAQCYVQNHRPICSCREGFEGNPNLACYPVGCKSDLECDSDKACISGECVNPCLLDNTCPANSECFVPNHRAECRCKSGFRGSNPYEACYIIGCRSDSDCSNDKSCINSECIRPCIQRNPCAPRNSDCLDQNHQSVCRCRPGYIGNPYFSCEEEPRPECVQDSDCPSQLACLNDVCRNPCRDLEPCARPSECRVIDSIPVRTMSCQCPDGYVGGNNGTCRILEPLKTIGCTSDQQCGPEQACFNGVCRNPCDCGPNADCRIVNHRPICSCLPGYESTNPNYGCYEVGCRSNSDCPTTHACVNRNCEAVCAPSVRPPCGTGADCFGISHTAVCRCPVGSRGNPFVSCITIGCEANSECPSDKACINGKCESPCAINNPCDSGSECRVVGHQGNCSCPSGFERFGNTCRKAKIGCENDEECPSQLACINANCVNPCTEGKPCGINANCRVIDTLPVRTMICECLPGYRGNAAVRCDLPKPCATEKGYVINDEGECVCPPGYGLDNKQNCIPCSIEKGFKITETGLCICATDRGMTIDARGECVCPEEYGYILRDGYCRIVPITGPPIGCSSDDECPNDKYCYRGNRTCQDPCAVKRCGINAHCVPTNHRGVCQCDQPHYVGNAETGCSDPTKLRTDFPTPAMTVNCLADGVQVDIDMSHVVSLSSSNSSDFNGLMYVKGHSKDPNCRKAIQYADTAPVDFKVKFGSCGLIHVDGEASFILVIQKHPKLVTYNAQAYHIKCVYMTGEKTITLGFNVSMLTTAGTIANTGPPPTCSMRIVAANGGDVNSAEIGESLILRVDVQPSSIYGGFARNCVAKTMDGDGENEYLVTDENGCATDPSIFGDWEIESESLVLMAHFNAFKFPSSSSIKFQCNVRVCFGKCQPVNCRGQNAFGRRRRSIYRRDQILDDTDVSLASSKSSSAYEGQLREEVTVFSNPILALERHEDRLTSPAEAPQVRKEEVCVSMIGFIISLIITALLALVAVAIAVSCWLMAYRRRPKMDGPLAHPPEFPNPLFTTPVPEPLEPSPDYLS